MHKSTGQIIYTFSAREIREQRLDGFLALFTRNAVAAHDAAHALLNSLHINFDLGRKKLVAPFEDPKVRGLCRRMIDQCPVLPWVTALDNQLYCEVVYAVLPDIQVTNSRNDPGRYEVLFREVDMEREIQRQTNEIRRIGATAKIQPDFIHERIEALSRYLREGVNIG